METVLVPSGTMISSDGRGFVRDYILEEDLTTEKEKVWVSDENGEEYQLLANTIMPLGVR